jgi:chlorite dismutase
MTDERPATFAAFWLYKARPELRRLAEDDRARIRRQFVTTIDAASASVTLRGAYSLAGLRSDADLMLWVHGPDLGALHALAAALRRTELGSYLAEAYCYAGMVPQSQYAPDHRPAFTKGLPPRDYLSMYPFVKTHEWYRLPFEQRRQLMAEHGRMGQKHSAMPEVHVEGVSYEPSRQGGGAAVTTAPTPVALGRVQANTIHSFGLGDQEFVVAFEADDPVDIVRMVEDLRAAEVRLYTAVDTPIFLGRRKSLEQALEDLG